MQNLLLSSIILLHIAHTTVTRAAVPTFYRWMFKTYQPQRHTVTRCLTQVSSVSGFCLGSYEFNPVVCRGNEYGG